jgi:hypothetical protein
MLVSLAMQSSSLRQGHCRITSIPMIDPADA